MPLQWECSCVDRHRMFLILSLMISKPLALIPALFTLSYCNNVLCFQRLWILCRLEHRIVLVCCWTSIVSGRKHEFTRQPSGCCCLPTIAHWLHLARMSCHIWLQLSHRWWLGSDSPSTHLRQSIFFRRHLKWIPSVVHKSGILTTFLVISEDLANPDVRMFTELRARVSKVSSAFGQL